MFLNANAEAKAETLGVVVIHGVADAEQGHNLVELCDNIQKVCHTDLTLELEPHVEVHGLRGELFSPDSRQATPPLYVRRGTVGKGIQILFAEAYWADTTRAGRGKLAALFSSFRVVFELHHFIDALVDKERIGLAGVVYARLLHFITFMVRGPIAAANVVLLSVAAIYLYGQATRQLADTRTVRQQLAPGADRYDAMSLESAVLLFCGIILAISVITFQKRRSVEDYASITVSVWVFIFSTASIVIIGWCLLWDPMLLPKVADDYGTKAYYFLTVLWTATLPAIVIAFVMALAISAIARGRGERAARARRSVWLALTLIILQAALWILFISVASIPLIGWAKLTPLEVPTVEQVIGGSAINAILLFCCLLVGVVIFYRRRRLGRSGNPTPSKTKLRGELLRIAAAMPRLVISKALVAAIVTGGMLHICLALVLPDRRQIFGAYDIRTGMIISSIAMGMALLLYWSLDKQGFANIIHIARDLIDHQFKPSRRLAWLVPALTRSHEEFPRRQRLLMRLKEAIAHLEGRGCTKIVIAAHSQGSVITYEYLKELAANGSKHNLAVVTFGSPLEDLYSYYFSSYADLNLTLTTIRQHIVSWTNIYRVDDFVGTHVGPRDNDLIENIPMGAGGHTGYWVEREVASAIGDAIKRLERGHPQAMSA
jgi:hypothetical protein